MVVCHKTKKTAEKERLKKKSPEAFVSIYQGPASGKKVCWVVKSRITGKRPKRK